MPGPQKTPPSRVTLSPAETLLWLLQRSPMTTPFPTKKEGQEVQRQRREYMGLHQAASTSNWTRKPLRRTLTTGKGSSSGCEPGACAPADGPTLARLRADRTRNSYSGADRAGGPPSPRAAPCISRSGGCTGSRPSWRQVRFAQIGHEQTAPTGGPTVSKRTC